MADLTLAIDRIELSVDGGMGHTHRVQPISKRAVAILQSLVQQRLVEWGLAHSIEVETLSVPPIEMDLARAGDEEIAERLAEAMYAALAAQLRL